MILKCGCETNDETKEITKNCEKHTFKEVIKEVPKEVIKEVPVYQDRRKTQQEAKVFTCPECEETEDYATVDLFLSGFFNKLTFECKKCGHSGPVSAKDKIFLKDRLNNSK